MIWVVVRLGTVGRNCGLIRVQWNSEKDLKEWELWFHWLPELWFDCLEWAGSVVWTSLNGIGQGTVVLYRVMLMRSSIPYKQSSHSSYLPPPPSLCRGTLHDVRSCSRPMWRAGWALSPSCVRCSALWGATQESRSECSSAPSTPAYERCVSIILSLYLSLHLTRHIPGMGSVRSDALVS